MTTNTIINRELKSNGVPKRYVVSLGIIIVALLMVAITFIVLYTEKPENISSTITTSTSATSSTGSSEEKPENISSTITTSTSTTSSTGSSEEKPENISSTITTSTSTTSSTGSSEEKPENISSTITTSTSATSSTGSSEEPNVIEYCYSQGCRTAANDLMRSINPRVNPCDDFYEFVCGNWNLTNPIPEEKGRWGVFDILDLNLGRILRDLLDQEENETLSVVAKVRQYYKSCMNEDAIEEAGIKPLYEIFMNIFPQAYNFPFSTTVAPTIDEIFAAFTQARRYGLTLGLMTNGPSVDVDNSRSFIINFDSASLPMERSFYLKEDNRTEIAAYKKYLVDMFQLFARKMGRTYSEDQATSAAESLIEFETILARAKLTPEARRDPQKLRNKMTVAEFARNFTAVIGIQALDIVQYFKVAWDNAEINNTLSVDTVINVAEPVYFSNITEYLLEHGQTENDRKALGNYLIWQIARSYVGRLGEEFQNISREFSAALRGIAKATPRWEVCINTVNNEFPNVVGRLYVMEKFQKPTKQRLENMTDYIFESFKEMVMEAEWMSNATKQRALTKAESFTVLAGYEDYIVDDPERLDQENADFNATDSYLGNVYSMQRLVVKEEAKSLLEGLKSSTWITGAAIVNAFYAPSLNSISFPAGILQPPFLGADYPDYWNFAAIGAIIGHEVTHGFDNQGAQFDEHGNLTNWWDSVSNEEFYRRAAGLVAQYSRYSLMDVQMNGILTLGENIADNGGVKEAFRGYQTYLKVVRRGKPEPRLPHLNFTPEQLFFLANAQVWCGDFRLKELQSQVRTGAHSPGRFRVIGPLQNFDEFSKAFSCPPGSYMNPETKYGVW